VSPLSETSVVSTGFVIGFAAVTVLALAATVLLLCWLLSRQRSAHEAGDITGHAAKHAKSASAGSALLRHRLLLAALPAVLADRNVELIGLYMEPDGTFPNHPANPLEPENLVDACSAVREHSADLGLVFDGDADRCFLIDERGEVVDPSVITAMIAVAELSKETGGVVVVNAITSQAVADAVAGLGRVEVSRVGHTFVKALMASENAIFGGEHSAHYYFRDFWGADTGVLAALHILEQLRTSTEPLSALAARFDGYRRSGEINSTVTDHRAVMERVAEAFEGRGDVEYWDGLTIRDEQAGWWINLRPSNTEPLLRLNVEARDAATMARLRDEVLTLVRGEEGENDD